MVFYQQGITALNRGNAMYKVQPHNNSLARQNADAKQPAGRRDTVAISPMQRANNLIAALKEQKQNIIKAKGELAKFAKESGKDYDYIKPRMDSYNEMLQKLDEQITGVMENLALSEAAKAEELKKKLEEKLSKTEADEPQTEEDLQAKELGDLTELSVKVGDVQQDAAISSSLEREKAILKSEIEFDESLSSGKPAIAKRATLKDIEKLQRSFDRDTASGLRDITQKLEELRDPGDANHPKSELPSEAELLEQEPSGEGEQPHDAGSDEKPG